MEVRAKGVEHPVILFEVLGIGGHHKLSLAESVGYARLSSRSEIPILYEVVELSQVGGASVKGLPDQGAPMAVAQTNRRCRSS